ncbi:MAG TPA: LLM class F420-dependent oxidoreductase [Frankiaceae bacterium]|nr:LLM class F420-dependent oxidoreductase [Frankiaceae bacterium]
MRYGVTVMLTDKAIGIVELAKAVEERGLDSVWLPEHTHIPTSRLTPPPTGDEVLAEEYKRSVDPFISLAAAAAVTTRLRLGTGVALAAQHDPIVTAKELATLDQLSGGRFVLGTGFGWNVDEMAHHGVDYATRREHAREVVLAMRALWEEEEASFQGKFVNFSPSWSWPKPVQQPLPILLGGGAGPKLFQHIVEYCQGWIPIGGAGLGKSLPVLRQAAQDAGRDPNELEIVPFGSHPDRGKLDYFAGLGVTECVFRLPSAPRDIVLPVLDEQARLVEEHRAG